LQNVVKSLSSHGMAPLRDGVCAYSLAAVGDRFDLDNKTAE
jgi:hypothetical protein